MQKLLKIYIATGAIFGGGYYLYNYKFGKSDFEKQDYFKESIKLLNGYKPAVDALGGKIELDSFDKSDKYNEISDKSAKIKMVVKGSKKLADFFVFASKQETDRNWNIDALEIKYRGSVSKFKIFDRSLITNTNSTNKT